MGKSARLRQRREAKAPDSTYGAVLRELRWSLKHVNSPEQELVDIASMAILEGRRFRIVRFPPEQALAFGAFSDDLVSASATSRPPFRETFYDFGFVRLGNYELAAALVVDRDVLDDSSRQEPGSGWPDWVAMIHMRLRGTDDWSVPYIQSRALERPDEWIVGQLGASADGRPPMVDETKLATRLLAGALVFLESANVDLVEAEGLQHVPHKPAIPRHEVVVRQASKRYLYGDDHVPGERDWSHRWEVRGHFKHFRKGRVFQNHPDRQITTPDGDRFVRVWCPSYVKGPEDKPLIPKVRVVS